MSLPLHLAGIVAAVLPHLGGPLMSIEQPPVNITPPPTGEISIAIDGGAGARPGGQIDYRITVRNRGTQEAQLTVRVSMPKQISRLYGASDATVIGNGIAWRGNLPAGESRSYAATGTVRRATGDADFAVTACALVDGQPEPTACTTRIAALNEASSKRLAWITAAIFGALGVISTVWLYRRLRPERLTPANAAAMHPEEPGQPGGAPSA